MADNHSSSHMVALERDKDLEVLFYRHKVQEQVQIGHSQEAQNHSQQGEVLDSRDKTEGDSDRREEDLCDRLHNQEDHILQADSQQEADLCCRDDSSEEGFHVRQVYLQEGDHSGHLGNSHGDY